MSRWIYSQSAQPVRHSQLDTWYHVDTSFQHPGAYSVRIIGMSPIFLADWGMSPILHCWTVTTATPCWSHTGGTLLNKVQVWFFVVLVCHGVKFFPFWCEIVHALPASSLRLNLLLFWLEKLENCRKNWKIASFGWKLKGFTPTRILEEYSRV